MSHELKKKRKAKGGNNQSFEQAKEQSYADAERSQQGNELNDKTIKQDLDKQGKRNQIGSNNKLRNADDETVGGESVDQSLPRPYEFLKFANPPLHTIFVPHFTVKSVTFVLTIIFLICFIILLVYNYTNSIQNKLRWNCSIFQLQNKYYPRIRYGYQFWRVPISFVFHSNIAHIILNVIGMQIYGYFVEWYYGKTKYIVALVLSGVFSHFFSCVAEPTSVSTTPSSFLFTILALKLYFLYEYKDYKPLLARRIFLYILFLLILGINLIPIFVNNNVDFTNHIGGFVVGLLLGLFFYMQKQQNPTKLQTVLKFGSVSLIGIGIVIFIALIYGLPDPNYHYRALNDNIDAKCSDPNQE